MKILHISDTHGKHQLLKDLPEADVIVHTGDITEDGTEEEVKDFIEWFGLLPYKHKIFIAGNHDNCLYGANIEGLPDNVHYLCNDTPLTASSFTVCLCFCRTTFTAASLSCLAASLLIRMCYLRINLH